MSLRIFGEDITTAAREASAARKKQKVGLAGEAAPDDTPVLEDENAGTSGQAEVVGIAEDGA